MSRGRSDSNLPLRERRATGEKVFHGNSTVVARACDRFLNDRGPAEEGFAGLITRSIRGHQAGRRIRQDKIDRLAIEIEEGWQS